MRSRSIAPGGAAAALLLGVSLVFSASAQEGGQGQKDAPKPGFFKQLGKAFSDAGKEAIGGKSAKGGASPGSASGGPIYTPISGAGKIVGLFSNQDHQAAQNGKLEWPRVALTFLTWGEERPCWDVEARIWTSSTASTTETFNVCSEASIVVKDDLGETGELNSNAIWKGKDTLKGVRVWPGQANTGKQRTTGPNPPVDTFYPNMARSGVFQRSIEASLRIAWVSGFMQINDFYPGPAGILTPFRDTRMWIAGFQPQGDQK